MMAVLREIISSKKIRSAPNKVGKDYSYKKIPPWASNT